MSKLGRWNKYFFQIFFTRLTKHIDKKVDDYKLLSYEQMHDGTIIDPNTISRVQGKIVEFQWYSFQFFPIPFTGWSSDYKYLFGKPKYLRITRKIKT